MNIIRVIAIGTALLFIQACSHPIEIEGQGDVTSASGNRNCSLEQFTAADQVCSKNFVIGAYQETYYATPRAGWQFDHWVPYCANAPPPNYDCSFTMPAENVYDFWGATVPSLKAVFIPLDTDGDGVPDASDSCPGTPVGQFVGPDGCPAVPPDTDGDGVADPSDSCPGTVAGAVVYPDGCVLNSTLDSDSDGVPNVFDHVILSAQPVGPFWDPINLPGVTFDDVVNCTVFNFSCPVTPIRY